MSIQRHMDDAFLRVQVLQREHEKRSDIRAIKLEAARLEYEIDNLSTGCNKDQITELKKRIDNLKEWVDTKR